MAAPTHILTLNFGSHSLGLAQFRAQPGGGLILQAFRLREILVEPAAENLRHTRVTAALREMLDELSIRNGGINYTVPSQSVFARFVKLPAVDEEKIERIIQFEAQQNVPFPIDDVVWDYQLVGGGADEQIQVVLVAIKTDLVEEMNAAVEATGVKTSIVGVATMALYNAFRYNYPDLAGCSLLIDIGARTTNLLFIEPGKVFSRSLALGGGTISSAIAKDFGEPLAAAEFRKKSEGFVGLGGAYAEPEDAEVARVSKIVRSAMTRLHAELMRSISHYRAQQQGSAPQRIFLAGGSASTPYMREFFSEKLQLPVEFFNPLRNVAVGDAAVARDVAKSAHLLGELVGLALRSIMTCPMELNLAPPSVRQRQQIARRRPFLILAAACFLIGLAGWSVFYFRAEQLERSALVNVQEKVDGLRAVETKMKSVRRETDALEKVAAPLAALVRERGFWPEVLNELNARLPKQDIWITELSAMSAGKVVGVTEAERAKLLMSPSAQPTPASPLNAKKPNEPMIDGLFVRGLYLYNQPRQQEVVVDFFRNLASSPLFKIDPNNQARVIKKMSTPNNTEWAFPYELQIELRNPVRLP